MRPAALFAGWLLSAVSLSAVAHGGGLNAEGCHNNRKTGDYHCHRAPAVLAPQAPPPASLQFNTSQPPVLQQAETPTRPATPTCFVGPRGGTYTITSSGRKNYGGC